MHVRQSRARKPRLHVRQTPVDDVECIQPSLRAHQRAERERLAARARAEVDDHVVALRRDEMRDQLAAFVLHFEAAVGEPRMLRQQRPAVDAQSEGRVAASASTAMPFGGQRGQRLVARRLQRVHAQIERSGNEQRARERLRVARRHKRRRGAPTASREDRRRSPARAACARRPLNSASHVASAARVTGSSSRTECPRSRTATASASLRGCSVCASAVSDRMRRRKANAPSATNARSFWPSAGLRAEERAKLRVGRCVEHAHALDRGGERRDLVLPHAHGVVRSAADVPASLFCGRRRRLHRRPSDSACSAFELDRVRFVDANGVEQHFDRSARRFRADLHRQPAQRRREPDVAFGPSVLAGAMPHLGLDRAVAPTRCVSRRLRVPVTL